MNLNNKAQTLAEYAIVISLILAALIGMQVYVKRGLQARLKDYVDAAATGISSTAGRQKPLRQYEPYYTDADTTTKQRQKISTTQDPGVGLTREWLPAIQDDSGNYSEGNVVERKGVTKTKGISSEELMQDDAWEK